MTNSRASVGNAASSHTGWAWWGRWHRRLAGTFTAPLALLVWRRTLAATHTVSFCRSIWRWVDRHGAVRFYYAKSNPVFYPSLTFHPKVLCPEYPASNYCDCLCRFIFSNYGNYKLHRSTWKFPGDAWSVHTLLFHISHLSTEWFFVATRFSLTTLILTTNLHFFYFRGCVLTDEIVRV